MNRQGETSPAVGPLATGARLRAAGSKLTGRAGAIVVIEVQRAAPVVSPAYDDGTMTEADMLEAHRGRFARLHERSARR
jgi:hypothetical protein